jgi:hypothetical protein
MKKPPEGGWDCLTSRLDSRQQFAQFPNMIRDASGHRRGNPRGAVDAAEVGMGDVQANRRLLEAKWRSFALFGGSVTLRCSYVVYRLGAKISVREFR